jgi:predicted DNA-binding transcriptional regulator YafY
MPVNKKQLSRLVKFVAMLKENRYPNSKSFTEELRKLDIVENQNLVCSRKTVSRDIKALQEEYNAPIKFDYDRNGFYLTHKGWDLPFPGIMNENEMLASVLGARLAEEIFPEPLRGAIRDAVDYQLTNNNPDFLDSASLKSLIVATNLNIEISPDIFMTVFEAWQEHKALDIEYESRKGVLSSRRIEPHILAFYDQAWFVKGICHLRDNEVRTFAVHRIIKAETTELFFEPDKDLIERTAKGDFLEYEPVENVKIICERELKSHLLTKPFHKQQRINDTDTGHFLLEIPAVPEHEILKWVMYQSGKARLLEPASLVDKIIEIGQFITNLHSK